MNRLSKYFVLVVMAGLALACGGQAAEEQPVEVAEAEAVAAPAVELVEVSAEGTEFEPAVDLAQIPEGAYYCPMETVHYASLEPGTCPVCGMELEQKMAAAEEEAAPAEDPEAPKG